MRKEIRDNVYYVNSNAHEAMELMSTTPDIIVNPSRESLIHALYEATELELKLTCTHLYAAFSLRSGDEEGWRAHEAEAVAR